MPNPARQSSRVRLKKAKFEDFMETDLRTMPTFYIFLGKENIGHIQTGHCQINPSLWGKGHFFFGALPKYEKMHARMFKKGLFNQYLEEVIVGIGAHKNKAVFSRYIRGLKEPTHLQFWRDPIVARKFMIHGKYTLSKPSIKELETKGLPKGATQEQIAEFLKTFKRPKYPNDVLLLLEKPISKKN